MKHIDKLKGLNINGVFVKILKKHETPGKGGLIELNNKKWFGNQIEHVYISEIFQNYANAWHCHLRQTDFFTVLKGTARICLYDARNSKDTYGNWIEIISPSYICSIVIPPGVLHGFEAKGSESVCILNTPSMPYCEHFPDEYRISFKNTNLPKMFESDNGDERSGYAGPDDDKKILEGIISMPIDHKKIGCGKLINLLEH